MSIKSKLLDAGLFACVVSVVTGLVGFVNSSALRADGNMAMRGALESCGQA